VRKLRIIINENAVTTELRQLRKIAKNEVVLGMEWHPDAQLLHLYIDSADGSLRELTVDKKQLHSLIQALGVIYLVGVYQDASTGWLEVHVCSAQDPRILSGGYTVPYSETSCPPYIRIRDWFSAGRKLQKTYAQHAAAFQPIKDLGLAKKGFQQPPAPKPIPFEFDEDPTE
jgi:hypothetical protein